MYWYCFSSTIKVFFYRHNIYSCSFFVLSGNIVFQDISWFCQIQAHFQDLKNEFVTLQNFQDAWEPWQYHLLVIRTETKTTNLISIRACTLGGDVLTHDVLRHRPQIVPAMSVYEFFGRPFTYALLPVGADCCLVEQTAVGHFGIRLRDMAALLLKHEHKWG